MKWWEEDSAVLGGQGENNQIWQHLWLHMTDENLKELQPHSKFVPTHHLPVSPHRMVWQWLRPFWVWWASPKYQASALGIRGQGRRTDRSATNAGEKKRTERNPVQAIWVSTEWKATVLQRVVVLQQDRQRAPKVQKDGASTGDQRGLLNNPKSWWPSCKVKEITHSLKN